jgi:hypothetical protein
MGLPRPCKMKCMRAGALAMALVGFCAACSHEPANPCSPAGPNPNCNVRSPVEMHQYDDARGCLRAAAPVPALCAGSVINGPCQGGSIGLGCAIAPDGGIFVTSLSGSEYVWGEGWRSSGDVAASADEGRCLDAQCSPACDGASLDDLLGRSCQYVAHHDAGSH